MIDENSPDMEKFRSALSDVVWRFHVYDQYDRDRKKAVKALKKRVPSYPSEFYDEQFDLNLKLLMTTIAAVLEAPKHFKPENKYSDASDVDHEYVMGKLRSTFPGQTDESLKEHLGMVIYWYYLR